MKRTKKKNEKAITLIALVITIIVLLILAGVSIATLTGENGLLTKAQEAKEQNTVAKERDELGIAFNGAKIGKLGGEVTAEDLNKQFEESKVKAQASGSNPIKIVFEETGNEYEINDEVISGPEKGEEGEQTTPGEEDSKAIKIKVNSGDDGIVALPIKLTEDCEIDWGDGEKTAKNKNIVVEKIASTKNIKLAGVGPSEGYGHIYNDKNKDYIVTISGNVKEITSHVTYENTEEGIEKFCQSDNNIIKEIVQWGETGLEDIKLIDFVNLRKIASPSKNSFINMESFVNTFAGCISLETIPEDLFANCPNVDNFIGTFEECTSLTSIPAELFANCPSVTKFTAVFAGCTSLTSIPAELFANCSNVTTFSDAFADCYGLTGNAIELWKIYPDADGDYCYGNCLQLDNYAEIPEEWK